VMTAGTGTAAVDPPRRPPLATRAPRVAAS